MGFDEILRNEVVKTLNLMGVEAEALDNEKNNVICHGVRVMVGKNLAVVCYTKDFEDKHGDVKAIATEIIKIAEAHKAKIKRLGADKNPIVLEELFTRDYISKHLKYGFLPSKEGESKYLTTSSELKGIDKFLYLPIDFQDINALSPDSMKSIRLMPEHLKAIDIPEEELWEIAEENTAKDVAVSSMKEVMEGIIRRNMEGADEEFIQAAIEDALEDTEAGYPMYVVTNKSSTFGAPAILSPITKEKMKECAFDYGKVIVIPSSVHEFLFVPIENDDLIHKVVDMVTEVNATEVSELERLVDDAYVYDTEQDKFCTVDEYIKEIGRDTV